MISNKWNSPEKQPDLSAQFYTNICRNLFEFLKSSNQFNLQRRTQCLFKKLLSQKNSNKTFSSSTIHKATLLNYQQILNTWNRHVFYTTIMYQKKEQIHIQKLFLTVTSRSAIFRYIGFSKSSNTQDHLDHNENLFRSIDVMHVWFDENYFLKKLMSSNPSLSQEETKSKISHVKCWICE